MRLYNYRCFKTGVFGDPQKGYGSLICSCKVVRSFLFTQLSFTCLAFASRRFRHCITTWSTGCGNLTPPKSRMSFTGRRISSGTWNEWRTCTAAETDVSVRRVTSKCKRINLSRDNSTDFFSRALALLCYFVFNFVHAMVTCVNGVALCIFFTVAAPGYLAQYFGRWIAIIYHRITRWIFQIGR